MNDFFRRTGLVLRGIAMFKDWDVWLAERLGKNPRTGLGAFRLRNGITFAIDYSTSMTGIFTEIWLLDYYERHHKIVPGDTVIDIGAHIGTFSVLAGSKGARVYSYEPTPESYELLKENTAKYNVHAFQLAVADVPGKVTLSKIAGRGSSGNSIVASDRSNSSDESTDKISVRATTLAEIFSENHIERCDLLKMDCEGAEIKILSGVPDDVFGKIKNITMEYHGNLPEVRRLLETNGYRILEIKGVDLGYIWATRA